MTNATKPEYCTREPRTELTAAFQADDFGTPISIEAGGVGRPRGGFTDRSVVPSTTERPKLKRLHSAFHGSADEVDKNLHSVEPAKCSKQSGRIWRF